MEGLQSEKEIDEEITENIEAFKELLGIESMSGLPHSEGIRLTTRS